MSSTEVKREVIKGDIITQTHRKWSLIRPLSLENYGHYEIFLMGSCIEKNIILIK